MTPRISCETCGRLLSLKGRPKCEAFPGGIPFEIITAQHDHVEPFRGDKGLRYIPIKKPEAEK